MNPLASLDTRLKAARNRVLSLPRWELLFYLAFTCYLFWQGFGRTTFESFLFIPIEIAKTIFQVVFVSLLTLSFILQKRRLLDVVLVSVLASIFLLSAMVCGDKTILLSFVLIAVGRDASIKNIAKIIFVFYTALLLVTMISSALGLIEVRYAVSADTRFNRSSWGFSHPNVLATVALITCMSWLYIRFPKISAVDAGVWILALIIINYVAQSRTSTLVLVVLAVVTCLYQRFRHSRLDKWVIAIVFIVGLLLIISSIYFMTSYDSSVAWQAQLNNLLTGRLEFANSYFEQYSAGLFGTNFDDAPMRLIGLGDTSRLIVDNSYARLIILFGYIPAFIWYASFVCLCVKYIMSNKLDYLFICFFVMLIFGFSESMMLSVSLNFTLFANAKLMKNFQCRSSNQRRPFHAEVHWR